MADSFSGYDVYAVTGSRYCYPDTSVLKNRFDPDRQMVEGICKPSKFQIVV